MHIGRSSIGWAILAALGAAYLVGGVALALLTPLLQWIVNVDQVLNHVTFPPPPTGIGVAATWGVAMALGALVGTIVARLASGSTAVALYASFLGTAAAVAIVRAVEAQRAMIDSFTIVSVGNVPEATALTFLPAGLAVVAGWTIGGLLRAAEGRTNAALEAAGAYAGVAIAASALGHPLGLTTGPYSVVAFGSPEHVAVVLAQSIVAGGVYAVRATNPAPRRMLLAFSLVGLAGVLPTEIMPVLLTLFLDWKYVPLSLLLVPLATAVLGLGTAAAVRIAPLGPATR